jgi:hypothetical protein
MHPSSIRPQVSREVASSADNQPATCGRLSSTIRISRTPRSTSSRQRGSDTLLDPEPAAGAGWPNAAHRRSSIVEAAHRRRRSFVALKFFEIPADEFHAAAAQLGDVSHGLTAITHPRQSARTFQALLRPALFGFQPDLRVPFCFPHADRAELLFGDQEGHHVFPVVGFSFQPLTVHLCLGITHLAAHIVFGLNRGHSGEPTTTWPIGANTSATLSTTNICARANRARQRPVARLPMPTFHVLCSAWAERADRRPNLATARLRSQILVPPPVLYSQIPFPAEYFGGFTTFTPSIATTPRPHTSKTRPIIICLVRLKIATNAPPVLAFASSVWTNPVQVIQIYIAISVAWATSRPAMISGRPAA